jgi:hypothetical protein
MSAGIKFFVSDGYNESDRTLHVTINMPEQTTNKFTISLSDGQNPKSRLTVLQEIQNYLSNTFIFEGGKTLDQIVKDVITTIDVQNMASNALRNNITNIKNLAKLYYRMWESKDKSGLSSIDETDEYRQNASIVIDMLSWWFIRRLVHIYVVCAILEKVHTTPQPPQVTTYTTYTTHTPFKPSSYPIQQTQQQQQQPVVIYTKDREFEAMKQKYSTNVSNLEGDKNQLQNDIKTLLEKHSQLELDNQQLHANNEYLAQRLDDLKQLLVQSTSMIFKLDEVPNIIMK